MKDGKKLLSVILLMMISINLFACNQSETAQSSQVETIKGLESLEAVNVISREEGSGTRDIFVEKIGLLEKDESGRTVDKTSSTASIKMDAESVIEEVAKNKNAIGYVSLGAITKETQGVKVIAVEGIKPDTQKIKSGNYLLSRNFNLAYSGKLSALALDFMTYILAKGQDIVNENYVEVKNSTSFLSDKSKGTIKIDGSTSIAPLMESLAKDYQKYNANAKIIINTTDTTSGLTAAMQGSCNLAMASRELKDYEKELLEYKTIAIDGVGVIVNEQNPVDSLSKKQLMAIFSGKNVEWLDLNNK